MESVRKDPTRSPKVKAVNERALRLLIEDHRRALEELRD